MPYEGLAVRHTAVATKATVHGAPCIEEGFPGVAFKNTQLDAYVKPGTTPATQIASSESFVIQVGGMHEIAAAKFPGAALPARGTAIYITLADNVLVFAATAVTAGLVTAGYSKYGRVDSVDTVRGVALVNAEARDTF